MIYYKDGKKMMMPVLTKEEYLAYRNGGEQRERVKRIRGGEESLKHKLAQMNYSCLPNEDGTLKGSTRMSNTVGMDIDWTPSPLPREGEEQLAARKEEWLQKVPELVLSKKDELGLMMLEKSATKGYHLVFRRRPELSQEENLRWASDLLGVKFDENAKDITRVFFTTTASELLFLSPQLFEQGEENPEIKVQNSKFKKVENNSQFSTLPLRSRDSLATPSAFNSQLKEDSQLTTDSKLSTLNSELQFRGIKYSEIIRDYWNRTGGEPQEGERNVKLHKLAVNLRAICDNKKEVLMQVMPRYGLSETEMATIIDSACKEPPKGISKVIQAILGSLSPSGEPEGGADSSLFTLNSSFKKSLPIGLRESLSGVPESMYMPVLCSVMPLAATYADQVEVEYCDGEMQGMGLMSIIHGEQASGKSVCKRAVNLWKRQFDAEDALAREKEEEWVERKKSRKANEKLPENPRVLIRVVPVTISCSTLLKRMKNAKGRTLYSFGEELDTLRKSNGAGSWSSKYDIYRMAFDCKDSEWGQDYNSDQAESGVVKVAYNWTMLGTNGAVRKCFKGDNVENGLSSRILLAEMPDTSFGKMPRYGRRSAEEEARIQEAVSRLRSYKGFVDTPRLRKTIAEWVEEKRVEALKDFDMVKDTYRRRAAVIGFRCGVIFHLLSGAPKETKACLDFAWMMAEYCLNQQIKVFGEALQHQYVDAQSECRRYGENSNIFDQLPPVFTADDVAALKRSDIPRNSIIKIISRWNRDGWVQKVDAKTWSKKKSDNDK
jgi:hypothetical protein